MAGKSKKTAKEPGTKITRITASESKKVQKVTKEASTTSKVAKATPKKDATASEKRGIATPFIATGNYFKGAWYELRQVRWPTRRATWSLTGAILVFAAIITVIILLLDALFKYLFELMLG